MWKILGVISKGSYQYAKVYGHPNSTANSYVLLHRIIMENHIGRLLTKEEIVHHKNGDKFNNNIENLQIMNRRSHGKLHHKESGIKRKTTIVSCENCKRNFEKFTNLIKNGQTIFFCSRSCNGSYHHSIGVIRK